MGRRRRLSPSEDRDLSLVLTASEWRGWIRAARAKAMDLEVTYGIYAAILRRRGLLVPTAVSPEGECGDGI